ncbi:hypothetical protein GGR54DRAFT_607747 [Hypoxylon sp. NC1633]|nr:hypothetical protein GGR54DRAFT_607747 [Hypoxylon sp. NC1633]
MAHAWLDSLSEDWVSQPRSDTSQAQLPTLSSSRANTSRKSLREPLSRIPRLNAGQAPAKKSQQTAPNSSSVSILNERSLSEINIRSSQRGPPKRPQDPKVSPRGRHLSRSVSASTAGSVVHNTVQQNKSHSASPSKNGESVPEWKRRLVLGELNYGESKDLFSSAGTGLENIFRPPVAKKSKGDESIAYEGDTVNVSILPSSPPPYARRVRLQNHEDDSVEKSAEESLVRRPQPPKQMKFRSMEDTVENSSRGGQPTSDGDYDGQEAGTNEPSQVSLNPKNGFDASRKISGLSVIRNEDLSPILISRHSSGDGKVSFAPVELPAEQLKKRLETLRRNQMLLDSEPNSDLGQRSASAADETPNIETTDDFVKNGGFLNIQRGGRSGEGSFRRRPLSPPLNADTSEMLPESSLQASTPKQFPTIRLERDMSASRVDEQNSLLSPSLPPAPHPSPEKRLQPPSGQSGSPLKLFGPYDTFTNQTLLRRISQFEDQMTDSPSRSMADETIGLPAQESPSKSEVNKGFVTESSPRKQANPGYPENIDNISTFGAGELDGFEFSEEITQNSIDHSQFTNNENMAPTDGSLPPSNLFNFQFRQDLPLDGKPLLVQRRRNRAPSSSFSPRRNVPLSRASNSSRPSSRPQSSSHPNGPFYGAQATPKRDGSDGKRPRTSPSKDPTPKRRRTLHRSDIAYGLEKPPMVVESVQSTHRNMQSVIGRKRQDTSQSELQQTVNPDVLAARPVLRPRSPTPGQRPSSARERQPFAKFGLNPDFQKGISDISIQDFATDGSGRTSMKTQDFFDAAEEIMAMIRNRARPTNGLSSVEESQAESPEQHSIAALGREESSFQESTKEPFSRPPSREGPPLARAPTRQENPELVDRLRQYEERSDLGEIITNSMHSMGRIREAINEANSLSESIRQSMISEGWDSSAEEQEVISDLSNVRISRNPDGPAPRETAVEFPSNGSRSSGASTGRSVPTNSSRGSDSKRLIAPDVVTPLIGNQVGNMVFDKEKNVWYKVKKPKPSLADRNILPSEDSEDPFASIPDLSVDLARETRNLALATEPSLDDDDEQSMQEEMAPRPSSAKSNVSTPESLNERSRTSNTKETFTRLKQTPVETAVEDDKEIEHEITIHEDRMQKSSPSRRRNLTISFSSPIASIIQEAAHQSDEDNAGQESDSPNETVEDVAHASLKRGRQSKSPKSVGGSTGKPRSRSRSAKSARNLSVKGQEFVPRPVSRIDEQDEDASGEHTTPEERQLSIRGESSLVYPGDGENPNTSLSVVVTTPAITKTALPSATPIIGQYVGTYSLSPLSDFTMHQADQSCGLEVSYVVGDRYLATGDGSKKIMSKAIQNLVEKITEVEPFEPDWECMHELEINDKHLTTLHMLDEFCTTVVTLNASNNSIEHLDGVPGSVRNLRITHNHLSELTAWGHLMNLQYIDVSNNQINSLHAFKDLVHLRSLRADNNQISSLDGIKMHDSLQVLRARGNLLNEVNLDGTKLQRLTELDLEDNQISSIHGIEQLACLVTLNLQHNYLTTFSPSTEVSVPNLKYLTLSGNDLATLDLSHFPSLRLLHADRNRLSTITGFSRCRRLDSLSLREQRGDTPLDPSFLNAAFEVRKLFLSGNLFPPSSFDPQVDFLNLQYLELANCGLRNLPADLGQLMPNLRVLNLNMNALEDVEALRYIPRLKKLLLAGNRLADAAQVADVLAGFPHLARLDVRDNPATQGFYAPAQALVPVPVPGDAGRGRGQGRAGDERGAALFDLPDANPELDALFASRSDLGTRMRRRLYEMVVLDRCRRLRVLDGLPVDPRVAGGAKRRDVVWDALVRSGVVEADSEPDLELDLEGVDAKGEEGGQGLAEGEGQGQGGENKEDEPEIELW